MYITLKFSIFRQFLLLTIRIVEIYKSANEKIRGDVVTLRQRVAITHILRRVVFMVEKVDVVLDNVLGISELFVNGVFAQTCFFLIISFHFFESGYV